MTQKEKLANVSRRWARELYSTNCPDLLVSDRKRQSQRASYTTSIAPTSTKVFGLLWRLPLPRPLKLYGRYAGCIVVANEFNVGIFVKVRVGMKFARDELVDLSWTRTKDVGQTA